MLPSLKGLPMVIIRADRAFKPLALSDFLVRPQLLTRHEALPVGKAFSLQTDISHSSVLWGRPPRSVLRDTHVQDREAGLSDLIALAATTVWAAMRTAHPRRSRGQGTRWRHRGSAIPRAGAVPIVAPRTAGRPGPQLRVDDGFFPVTPVSAYV